MSLHTRFSAWFGHSEDARFRKTLSRAHALQRAGFDVGFRFLPRYPDMPHLYTCDARLGDEHLLGAGFDVVSQADAFAKALSEVLERALWRDDSLYAKVGATRTTPRSFGPHAIDLSRLAGFSTAQRSARTTLQFDEDTELMYSKGIRLSNRTPLYVPTQLVSGSQAAHDAREPLLRERNSNGLATHASFDQAARSALLELIERDAFMITFFNQIAPPRINRASIKAPPITTLLSALDRYGFLCELLLLPTDMPVHVVCCVLRDPSGVGPALVVGAKAETDIDAAILGAITEALGVYRLARDLGLYREALPQRSLHALERIAYWGKQEHTEKLSWLWSGYPIDMPHSFPSLSAKRLARAAEAHGCTVAAIDMTPPTVRTIGLHAVCVVSPDLQPLNLDESNSYEGGARLRTVPERLGYTAHDAPPPYPHPFP